MQGPKAGDRIPTEKFHVSEMNVRYGQAFGESEEDQQLIINLRRGKIIGPFKARPEDEGYGVVVGRRRFLGKKEAGAKIFVVGQDCLIEEMTDEEAREASLVENLEILRKGMDAMSRARALNRIISFSPTGVRGTARRLGISASTLSEWLQVLELSPKMQEALEKGKLFYTDGLKINRMKLGEDRQNELAELLEKEDQEGFKRELDRISAGKTKRGIPKGIYEVDRVTWDKRNRKEMAFYEAVKKVAERKGLKVAEYIKDFVIRHIDQIKEELA